MRFYQLLIDGEIVAEQSFIRPTGLSIEFDVPIYDIAQNVSSEIVLYNALGRSIDEIVEFDGKPAQLIAGFEDTRTTSSVNNGVIVNGTISTLHQDPSGIDIPSIISIFAIPPSQANQRFEWNIKKGQTIQSQLNAVSASVNIPFFAPVDAVADSDEHTVFETLNSFAIFIRSRYGLVGYGGRGGIVFVDLTEEQEPIAVDSTDMVQLPVATGLNQYNVQFKLRSDLLPNRTLFINNTNFDTSQLAGQSPQRFSVLRQGLFRIINVTHRGQSRNQSAQSWVTIVNCIPLGNINV